MWLYPYELSGKDNPYHTPPFAALHHMSYIDNLPTWSYPWHSHDDFYEIDYIMQGKGCLYIGSQSLPLEAGSIAVLPLNVMHHLASTSEEDMPYYSLGLFSAPNTKENELLCFFDRLGSAVTPGVNHLSYMKQTLQLLFHLQQTNGGRADATVQTICLGLLQLTRELFTNQALSPGPEEHLAANDILSYISEHAYEKISLDSLARHFNVSPSQLSRIFFNAYHRSPIDYIIHSRITYATEYLMRTDLPVNKIAELVGYENPTHFTNLFIKRIGCTPAEYRTSRRTLPPELLQTEKE